MIHIQYMNSQMRVLLRKYARGLRLYDLAVVFLNKNLRTRRGYPSLQLKAVERLGIRLLGHVSVAGENYYGNADEEKL